MESRTLLPYVGAKNHNYVHYCQLDSVELYGGEELRNHANALVLSLQEEIKELEQQITKKDEIIGKLKEVVSASECEVMRPDKNYSTADVKPHYAVCVRCGVLKEIKELEEKEYRAKDKDKG